MRSLYFKIFPASFLITFLSPGTATFFNRHAPFLFSRIVMSGLFLGIVLSVHTYWFHAVVTLPSWLISTDFGLLSNFIPISLHLLTCSWAHTLSCLFMYCSFAKIGHTDMTCFNVSSIIVIIIIIIVIIISFIQGIYTYFPETNFVTRECSVAAILLLIFVVFISFFQFIIIIIIIVIGVYVAWKPCHLASR